MNGHFVRQDTSCRDYTALVTTTFTTLRKVVAVNPITCQTAISTVTLTTSANHSTTKAGVNATANTTWGAFTGKVAISCNCIDQFQCCMMYDGCKFANWWKSFDRKGWAQCDSKQYITGLWRNVNLGSRDKIYLLEEAKCCSAPAPFQNVQSTCREANWWSVLDK